MFVFNDIKGNIHAVTVEEFKPCTIFDALTALKKEFFEGFYPQYLTLNEPIKPYDNPDDDFCAPIQTSERKDDEETVDFTFDDSRIYLSKKLSDAKYSLTSLDINMAGWEHIIKALRRNKILDRREGGSLLAVEWNETQA